MSLRHTGFARPVVSLVAGHHARAAEALRGGGSFDVDFNLAVQRHKLIDAIERSSATGRSAKVQ